MVCLVCALSDALLIAAGVSGFYVLAAALPGLLPAAKIGGAVFLFGYGARSFWSAWRATESLTAGGKNPGSLSATVAACLAFTWLNPHVYLDTVVLLGSVSTQYEGAKIAFAGGAMSASFAFFFALGYGAAYLAPWFAKPRAWKILDVAIGAVMWYIAATLLIN